MSRLTKALAAVFGAAAVALVASVLGLAVAVGALALSGATPVVITGASMTPTIGVGSLAVAWPLKGDGVVAGDVVTFAAPNGTFVTHRVAEVVAGEVPLLVTKGDANAHSDPNPTPVGGVVGEVYFSIPGAGFALAMLQSVSGIIAIVSLLASLLSARRAFALISRHGAIRGHRVGAARVAAVIMLLSVVTSLPVTSSQAVLSDAASVVDNTFSTGSW